MTKILIDGKEIDVPAEYTLLQACEAAGAEIPRFCYHERLSIAGNCRMCLVEVEKFPKLAPSCATAVAEGQVVHVHSEKAREARKGVLAQEAAQVGARDQPRNFGEQIDRSHSCPARERLALLDLDLLKIKCERVFAH